MTFFFEVSFPIQIKPGYFSAPFDKGRFRRTWWLCFAIGFVNLPMHEYHEIIRSGASEWRTS